MTNIIHSLSGEPLNTYEYVRDSFVPFHRVFAVVALRATVILPPVLYYTRLIHRVERRLLQDERLEVLFAQAAPAGSWASLPTRTVPAAQPTSNNSIYLFDYQLSFIHTFSIRAVTCIQHGL